MNLDGGGCTSGEGGLLAVDSPKKKAVLGPTAGAFSSSLPSDSSGRGGSGEVGGDCTPKKRAVLGLILGSWLSPIVVVIGEGGGVDSPKNIAVLDPTTTLSAVSSEARCFKDGGVEFPKNSAVFGPAPTPRNPTLSEVDSWRTFIWDRSREVPTSMARSRVAPSAPNALVENSRKRISLASLW